MTEPLDLRAFLTSLCAWSEETFGPGPRPETLVAHIRKELIEVEEDPADVVEWLDVALLAFDGACRSGRTVDEVVNALVEKDRVLRTRTFPNWRDVPPGEPVEHIRD